MKVLRLFLFVSLCVLTAMAQTTPSTTTSTPPAPGVANSDPTYQALRHISVGTEAVAVNNVVLNREGGKFTFRSGTVTFLAPVNGKVTGAVFTGDGIFTIDPPTQIERNSLARLTGGKEFVESYSHLVLRFTDGTYDELKKAGTPGTPSGDAGGILDHVQDELRSKIFVQSGYNLHGRLLQDVLSGKTNGLFIAFIHGKNYDDKMVFAVDPHGVRFGFISVAPEEVALFTYGQEKFGVWAAYHLLSEYAGGHVPDGNEKNGLVYDGHQKLNTSIEKSGYLKGDALTTIVAGADGLRVAQLMLFPTLRVKSVTDTTGQPLAFIQEDRYQDPQFFVILPQNLGKKEQFTIRTIYEGKDAVSNEGSGNYFPVARANWYPNTFFGDYATYDLTFRIPKSLKIIGTGNLVSERTEGDQVLSEWQSGVPIAVAGFNLGKFKEMTTKLKSGVEVDAYANTELPDRAQNVLHGNMNERPSEPLGPGRQGPPSLGEPTTLGSLETTELMKKPYSEAQVAVSLYTDYFGPMSYQRIAMSQQTDCGFGQSWPTLVYLPMCAMYDTTVRHQFQMDRSAIGVNQDNTYWNAVGAHETAHQWWGHTVGFNSYRDQWMSEGFAHLSTSIFLQAVYTENHGQAYHLFWTDMLKELTVKNQEGKRPIDVGPVTLGWRLEDSKTGGGIYARLVYPKGAYILHMIRQMMWDPQTGDANFKAMMHDFVETYRNKPASTEDFKAVVEKHITPEMNLSGNGKLNWFFDEYVYGTYLPNYQFTYSFGKEANGTPNVHVKLVQSNVDKNFGMLVPLYLEMNNGKILRVGSAPMIGNNTVEQTIPLAGLKETPKRALINYNQDVLSTTE